MDGDQPGNNPNRWIEGPLPEILQVQVNRLYSCITDVRTAILRATMKLFFTGFLFLELQDEIDRLEDAINVLIEAEDTFMNSTSTISLLYGRVSIVTRRLRQALTLAQYIRNELVSIA